MADPQLLILDEPTVGMDVEIRRAFWASMRDFIADGRTVLFATHHLDEADTEADRIVVLARGRLIADGTPSMIKSRVADRTITLADRGVRLAELARLPAVIAAERMGSRLQLRTTDSDRHPAGADHQPAGSSRARGRLGQSGGRVPHPHARRADLRRPHARRPDP